MNGPEDRTLASWPVAILAGGLATRLRPVTEKVPKALLELAGEPFIIHQLRLLKAAGFRRFVLCLGYLGNQIEALLGDGVQLGLRLQYSYDGEKLVGTGGALRQAMGLLGERFVVLYGDSYLPIDYRPVVQAFLDSGQDALMTIHRNAGRWDTSNVLFRDDRIQSYNKVQPSPEMDYIDYGLGVLSQRAFDVVQEREVFDLAEVYRILVEQGRMAGYEIKERFYEIGSAQGLAELDALLGQKSDGVKL